MRIKLFLIIFFLTLTVALGQKALCSNDTNEEYDHDSYISDFYDIAHLILDEEYKQANHDAQILLNKAEKNFGSNAHDTTNAKRLFAYTNIHIKNYNKAKEVLYPLVEPQQKNTVFYVIDTISIAIIYELEGNQKESNRLYKEAIDITRVIYGQSELQDKLLAIIGYFENYDIVANMKPIKNITNK